MNRYLTEPQQAAVDLLRFVNLAILETIQEAGDPGAPDGLLFAAMQAHRATLAQYREIMSILASRAYVTLDEDCYRLTDAGIAYVATLKQVVERSKQSRAPSAQSGPLGH